VQQPHFMRIAFFRGLRLCIRRANMNELNRLQAAFDCRGEA
jgi:hypothetical protein